MTDTPPIMRLASIPGSKTMLLGAPGTGKTYCLKTFVEAGVTPFILFTEPGMETLGEFAGDPPDCKIHWKYVPPARPSWDAMLDSATKINTYSFKALSGLGDINKQAYGQLREVYMTCADFVCDRCGEHFGPVDEWGTDRAFVLDSLSGVNIMSMDLVVGSKPVKAVADWGVAMDTEERFLLKLTTDVHCFVVVTGHLEREMDEVTGGVQLMASALGRRLAPRIPRFFSDVIQCVREGQDFVWRTDAMGVDLKFRNVPLAGKIPPTFVEIVKVWKGRGGKLLPAKYEQEALNDTATQQQEANAT